jgi:hypothetical protein
VSPHRSHLTTLEVLAQPDETTCGPTCLQAVYRYHGEEIDLGTVIDEVRALPDGGTLAVWLGIHALGKGYSAHVYTYNLHVFDPSWFGPGMDLPSKLRAQRRAKPDPKLSLATDAYLEFLDMGGEVHYVDLTSKLLRRFLKRELPVLTGLSATYLYGCPRERNNDYDDVRGEPAGHFVVLAGYDKLTREVLVADPLHDNPGFGSAYRVRMDRLISAILLGIVTYDANLLVIEPGEPS